MSIHLLRLIDFELWLLFPLFTVYNSCSNLIHAAETSFIWDKSYHTFPKILFQCEKNNISDNGVGHIWNNPCHKLFAHDCFCITTPKIDKSNYELTETIAFQDASWDTWYMGTQKLHPFCIIRWLAETYNTISTNISAIICKSMTNEAQF